MQPKISPLLTCIIRILYRLKLRLAAHSMVKLLFNSLSFKPKRFSLFRFFCLAMGSVAIVHVTHANPLNTNETILYYPIQNHNIDNSIDKRAAPDTQPSDSEDFTNDLIGFDSDTSIDDTSIDTNENTQVDDFNDEMYKPSQDLGGEADADILMEAVATYNDEMIDSVPLQAVDPETLKTFVQVIDLVRREYVEPVNDEILFIDAMAGMLEKLDTYAEFLDAEAYQNLRAFTEGDIGQVGLQVRFNPTVSQWVIEKVAIGSPAQQAGLHEGDYLHQVNDVKLSAGLSDDDVIQLLSGIAGTQVDVVISEEGRTKRHVTLQRNIALKQRTYVEVIGDVGYIKLPVFQNDTAAQIVAALQQLKTPITGVLIDIRNNPGGVLKSAVDVASLFMDNTQVVKIIGRNDPARILSTHGIPILKDLPLVVLQNRYSASASEVLASSLQNNKRALIVGERSYGKGSVQEILQLNDEQAIKLTVAHYYGADGSRIEGVGITPDIILPDDNVSAWRQQALTILLEQERPLGIIFNTPEGGISTEEDY